MKKAIALILCLVFIATLLIACGDNNTDTITNTDTTVNTDSSNTNTDTTTDTDIASKHSFEDDGNCTTAEYCDTCGELVLEAKEHDFSNSISYNFREESFLQGGLRNATCANDGCTSMAVLDVKPFIEAYGYSVTEYENKATITASYAFNNDEFDYYSNYLNASSDDEIKIEYGIIGYIKRMVKVAPIKSNGKNASYVIKGTFTGYSGINDFSIPSIGENFYGEEIVICAYMIIGEDIYYIQGNEIVTDYTELSSITVNYLIENAK